MFRYVTRYNTLVSHHEQLEGKLVSAIMAAHRIPKGPSHLSIPSDVLRSPATLNKHIQSNLLVHDFSLCDDVAIAQLCELLASARNVTVYVGDGIDKANQQIMDFIELTNATFVSGPVGKSWVNEKHPQYRGVFGFAGHVTAKALLQNQDIDIILAVGTALGELGTSGWTSDLLNPKLVHIDSSIEHFTRSSMAKLHVFGNMATIFERLLDYVRYARANG
jgi:acetolactate synthase-1/2/3 large subunit